MTFRRVKVIITGYYDIDLSRGLDDYKTSDPEEMLEIDQAAADQDPHAALDWAFDNAPKVALSWED